jgi:O-antigen/teichoic acid export membrane protein
VIPRRFLEHKFVRDTATLQIGTVLNSIGNFASTLALTHLLGAAHQGELFTAIALYSLLWLLLGQGVVAATVSQVAAASARGMSEKAAAWLALLAKAHLSIGVVLVPLGYLVLPWLATAIGGNENDARWAWWLCWTPFLEMPRVVACAGLQGTRRMLPLAQIENTQEAARVFLVVLGALITDSPLGPVIGTLVASAIGSIVAIELFRVARRDGGAKLPSPREIVKQVRDVPLRAALPLGMKMGLVRSVDALNVKVVPLLLVRKFGSSESVAYLRIAQTFMSIPLLFMQGLSRTTLPVLSDLAGLRDMQRFKRTFVRASLLGGAFISTGILIAVVFLPWILQPPLFPESYCKPVWIMCLILLPGFLVMSFSIANDTFYLVTNTLRAGVVICVIGLVVNVIVMSVLGHLYSTKGVAWGLSFTMASAATHYVFAAWYFRTHRELGA